MRLRIFPTLSLANSDMLYVCVIFLLCVHMEIVLVDCIRSFFSLYDHYFIEISTIFVL